MSTEEPDIRTDAEQLKKETQPAEETHSEGTAYLYVDGSEPVSDRTVQLYARFPGDTRQTGIAGDEATEESIRQTIHTIMSDKDSFYGSDELDELDELEEPDAGDTSATQASQTAYYDKTVAQTETAYYGKTVTMAVPAAGEPDEDGEGSGSDGEDGAAADGEGEEGEQPEKPEKDPEIEAIKKKIIERRREKKRKARMQKVRFWTILSVVLFTVAAVLFSLSNFFIVDSIEVTGNSHFTAEEIINIAHAVPGRNIIYNPGTKEITDYLEQNPYIKSASVTRKLPATIVINVNERKEACAFQYDDDYLVMDDEGTLLKKTRTEPKITMINGMIASKIKLGQTIGTENQQTFRKTLKLIRAMNAADLYFVRIDMSEYEDSGIVRAYVYDKLIVKSDYDILIENIDNGRLHKILEELFDNKVKRGTILFGEGGSASFQPGI